MVDSSSLITVIFELLLFNYLCLNIYYYALPFLCKETFYIKGLLKESRKHLIDLYISGENV